MKKRPLDRLDRAMRGLEDQAIASRRTDAVVANADRVMARLDKPRHRVPSIGRVRHEKDEQSKGLAFGLFVVAGSFLLVGLVTRFGLFGFIGAIFLAIALLVFFVGGRDDEEAAAEQDAPEDPRIVDRFDLFLHKTRPLLPGPAVEEIDAIQRDLSGLKKALARVPRGDPQAREAERLMERHLPNLVHRYVEVPARHREEKDGEGLTADERVTEGLAAGRQALDDYAAQIARKDLRALETQGRFLKSRYGAKDSDKG